MKIKVTKKLAKILFYSLGIGLAVIAITLFFLPADYFDTGQSMCVSVLLFDMECYACGMTRAIMHMIHFEFQTAWEYNKIAFVVFPLLVFMILVELRKFYQKMNDKD